MLATSERTLGLNHPALSQYLSGLGLLYIEQGEYTQAEPLLKRALAIREKALGPDHPDVPQSLNSLAALYRATERDTEAAMLEQRTARIEAIQR